MQNFMTRDTHQRLIEQLKKIKEFEIPRISKEKLEAARQGDLSENAEYDAAKEKLEMLMHRYSQLEGRMSNVSFIEDLNIPGTVVSIGTTVIIKEIAAETEKTYTILGVEDSDVDNNIISFQSPIAKGIIGKKIGDKCEITLPEGSKAVLIQDIKVYNPS